MGGLFHEVAIAHADHEIAHGHGGTVAEDAVEHLALREGGSLAVEAGEVGDHLALDVPYGQEFRNDGEPAERTGRKCESACGGGGLGSCGIRDLSRAGGGIGDGDLLRFGNAADQFENGIAETAVRFLGGEWRLFHRG